MKTYLLTYHYSKIKTFFNHLLQIKNINVISKYFELLNCYDPFGNKVSEDENDESKLVSFFHKFQVLNVDLLTYLSLNLINFTITM